MDTATMPPAAAAPSSTADIGGAIIAQLTVAELRALCAFAGQDEALPIRNAVTFLYDGRACSTNGHVALIRGSTTSAVGITDAMASSGHSSGAGAGVRLQLPDIEAFLKGTKTKDRIVVRRQGSDARLLLQLLGPTGAVERWVVIEGDHTFSPVAYVFGRGSRKKGNGIVGVNVTYLALLAKVEAALPKARLSPWTIEVGGDLDPILCTASCVRESQLPVAWVAAISPVKL